MAPPPVLSPPRARRLPIITESAPTSPGRRSFFSFRRQSLPPPSPITTALPSPTSSPTVAPPPRSSSIRHSSPAGSVVGEGSAPPTPTTRQPSLPSPTRPFSQADPEGRLPRSSGTFGFTDRVHPSEEDMFERLGPDVGGRVVDSPAGGATPAEVESDVDDPMDAPRSDPRVVVQVQESTQDSEILDGPLELVLQEVDADQESRRFRMRTDSVESLLDQPQRRGGTFGMAGPDPSTLLTPDRRTASHPDAAGPALIPLLLSSSATPPPQTAFFTRPQTLNHQSSTHTMFHTPHSSPAGSTARLVDPSPDNKSLPELGEVARTALDLGSGDVSTKRESSENGKTPGSWRAESEGGLDEKMRRTRSRGSPVTPDVPLPPSLPITPPSQSPHTTTTTAPTQTALLTHHRTRLTSLAQTLQLESRRLSQSRERLENINVELAKELELMVAELGRSAGNALPGGRGRTISLRAWRDQRGKEGQGGEEEEGMRTDDEGGPKVRRQPSVSVAAPAGVGAREAGLRGSPLKKSQSARVSPPHASAAEEKGRKKKKERKSWGERLFGAKGK